MVDARMIRDCPRCNGPNALYLDVGDITCIYCGLRSEYAPPKDAAALQELDPRHAALVDRRKLTPWEVTM